MVQTMLLLTTLLLVKLVLVEYITGGDEVRGDGEDCKAEIYHLKKTPKLTHLHTNVIRIRSRG